MTKKSISKYSTSCFIDILINKYIQKFQAFQIKQVLFLLVHLYTYTKQKLCACSMHAFYIISSKRARFFIINFDILLVQEPA